MANFEQRINLEEYEISSTEGPWDQAPNDEGCFDQIVVRKDVDLVQHHLRQRQGGQDHPVSQPRVDPQHGLF